MQQAATIAATAITPMKVAVTAKSICQSGTDPGSWSGPVLRPRGGGRGGALPVLLQESHVGRHGTRKVAAFLATSLSSVDVMSDGFYRLRLSPGSGNRSHQNHLHRSKSEVRAAANDQQEQQQSSTESETSGNGVDILIGRAAMLGFVAAAGFEIVTGKGLLEAAGMVTPHPTVALILTIGVVVLTTYQVGLLLSDRN